MNSARPGMGGYEEVKHYYSDPNFDLRNGWDLEFLRNRSDLSAVSIILKAVNETLSGPLQPCTSGETINEDWKLWVGIFGVIFGQLCCWYTIWRPGHDEKHPCSIIYWRDCVRLFYFGCMDLAILSGVSDKSFFVKFISVFALIDLAPEIGLFFALKHRFAHGHDEKKFSLTTQGLKKSGPRIFVDSMYTDLSYEDGRVLIVFISQILLITFYIDSVAWDVKELKENNYANIDYSLWLVSAFAIQYASMLLKTKQSQVGRGWGATTWATIFQSRHIYKKKDHPTRHSHMRIYIRCFMDLFINGFCRTIIILSIPIWMMCGASAKDIVMDSLQATFISQLDDVDSFDYLFELKPTVDSEWESDEDYNEMDQESISDDERLTYRTASAVSMEAV